MGEYPNRVMPERATVGANSIGGLAGRAVPAQYSLIDAVSEMADNGIRIGSLVARLERLQIQISGPMPKDVDIKAADRGPTSLLDDVCTHVKGQASAIEFAHGIVSDIERALGVVNG